MIFPCSRQYVMRWWRLSFFWETRGVWIRLSPASLWRSSRGGSGGHLLFCWGHYGSPLSRCWSVLAAHRCSSTPADKCHVSRWFQRCWLGLLEGQVDNSDVYSRTAPQSLAPAGMVMPSGNEWIGGSHHLYHMPRSDPTLAPEENGKKLLWFTEFDIFGAMTEPVRCLGQFLGWCHRLINMHAKQFVTSTQAPHNERKLANSIWACFKVSLSWKKILGLRAL